MKRLKIKKELPRKTPSGLPVAGRQSGRWPVGMGYEMKLAAAMLLLLLCPGAFASKEKPSTNYLVQLPPRPDFSGLDWLVGDWSGKTDSKQAQGEILLRVTYTLDKRFLQLHEEVSLPATRNAPPSHESWTGILSAIPTRREFTLRTYSDTGFVLKYRVTVREGEIDLSPEGGDVTPSGWLFRRTFQHVNPGVCDEVVEAAPPHQSFFTYYTAHLNQVTSNKTAAPSGPAASPANPTGAH